MLTSLSRRLVLRRNLRSVRAGAGSGSVIESPATLLSPAALTIGRDVYVGPRSYVAADGGIDIGDGVMIGPMLYAQSSSHVYDGVDLGALPYDHRIVRKPISIGRYVWIGGRVTINPGVSIDEGAIIGAGTVVPKDIPRLAIVVGNPARIIGYRDPESFERLARDGMSHARLKRSGMQPDVWLNPGDYERIPRLRSL
ncbi:MAG: acyltransferase [Thermoleophilia bacterium]|nr:acyltransferase [Thermoleophilia bacterium]